MGTVARLKAAGIGVGDEVIVPAFGTAEAAEAVVRAGAVPVFADIDEHSFCLDADAVAAVVSPRTAAVIVVHSFGHPADLPGLYEVGRSNGLLVLEQAECVDPYQDVARRRASADYLSSRLRGVIPPVAVEGHTYQQYVARVPGNGRPDRDAFARAVMARGVQCQVPVKTPVHRLPGFRQDVFLPATARAAEETLALPLDCSLSRRELHRIVATCNGLGGLLQPAFQGRLLRVRSTHLFGV